MIDSIYDLKFGKLFKIASKGNSFEIESVQNTIVSLQSSVKRNKINLVKFQKLIQDCGSKCNKKRTTLTFKNTI